MAFRTLRARVLFFQSALVICFSVAALVYVSTLANRFVSERISTDLARSRDRIKAEEVERYKHLTLAAEYVASFPQTRALFTATDAPTTRDFLLQYLRQPGEVLIAVSGAGTVIARTDTFEPLDIPRLKEDWVQPALAGRSSTGYLELAGHLYHAALAVAETAGTAYGFIVDAAPVDDGWAHALQAVTSDKEIVILSTRGIAGSTVAADRIPWRSAADIPVASGDRPEVVDLGGERFLWMQVPVSSTSPIRVVSLQSRDLALRPYRQIQVGLLGVALIAAGVGIGGSAVFARSLAAPVRQLAIATHKVADGTYEVTLDTTREDEIGDLARSFKKMTEGLRERADMQKFMSHSTVAMIQSRQTPERRLGERRNITLLFCDIRGFTAFAERRAPEEAVQVLNRYLHLQADLVQRFRGDVDKFIGDAVFAHFAGPDMALDAIRCAVEIQHAVDNASRTDATLPALAVGIGIATGEVIVGSVGSDDRLDHTAIGPAVNLANRLCATAEAHEVLISEPTFDLVRDLIAAEAVPPLVVKGFSEPVRAYRMRVRRSADGRETEARN
jgi:class 3 adenylate cyclase